MAWSGEGDTDYGRGPGVSPTSSNYGMGNGGGWEIPSGDEMGRRFRAGEIPMGFPTPVAAARNLMGIAGRHTPRQVTDLLGLTRPSGPSYVDSNTRMGRSLNDIVQGQGTAIGGYRDDKRGGSGLRVQSGRVAKMTVAQKRNAGIYHNAAGKRV